LALLEGTLIKSVAWLASLGALACATMLVFPRIEGEPEPVSAVYAVRLSEADDAPGKTDVPEMVDIRTMVASYYASSLAGNPTASGEVYRPERYTAAHRTLPLGTVLRISHAGESVEVVINDRGPYVPGHDLDLSFAAAEAIGLVDPGVAPVRVAVL
jgi:hypothetical protein